MVQLDQNTQGAPGDASDGGGVDRQTHGHGGRGAAEDALSFSVLNVGAPFRSRATVNLRGTDKDKPGGLLSTDRVTITLSADKGTATVNMVTDKKPTTRIELTASELDAVLAVLREARAVMHDKVTFETPEVRGILRRGQRAYVLNWLF